MKRTFTAVALALGALSSAGSATAATGICDSNPPTTTTACIQAIQNAGGVVNDVFKDANGKTADQLPVYGTVFNNWPGCDQMSFAGCAGKSNPPYDCPGNYVCENGINTFANASKYANQLDRLWWHPARITNHNLVNGCPDRTQLVPDGVPGHYFPWEGLVFDLGGPSNQVAIFAQNDHGPQPCESIEYTVYLTDNPFAKEAIEDPATTGADPQKWNRAVLKKIFTKGFVEVRPPNPAQFGVACGDTAQYSVEEDSFVQTHSMPCGINFRYTSIVAGYDGKEFPACQFHSQEGEVDAVAGLTEDGSGVCPDADKDGFVDCNCTGAPVVCDCNDADDKVHPGAPEACDAGDLNCDGVPGACSGGLFCHQSICVPPCQQGEFACPKGSTCQVTSQGALCVPSDCSTGGCPPGSTCDPVSKTCKPACDGVVCPFGQKCNDGKCIDPCANLVCPSPKQCVLGECVAPCNCFAGDVGCKAGEVCDKGNTDLCTTPACQGVVCAPGQHCDPGTGQCQGVCDGVKCPAGEKCDPVKKACVGLCDGVTCAAGEVCDPANGQCVDDSCKNVTCIPPSVCVAGSCVAPDGGVGGGPADASAGGAAASGGGTLPPKGSAVAGDDGGCGCTTPGGRGGTFAALLALLGLGALASRRRRAS